MEKPSRLDRLKNIARSLRKLKKDEQAPIRSGSKFYNLDRDSTGSFSYEALLMGYKYFIKYVSKLEKNTVLDLGAGTTSAISQIQKATKREGLDVNFIATTLTKQKDHEKNLGSENIFITPAETLKGIPDKSVGGIIAVHSLTYVVDVEMAVKSMDRVLCDKGVIKANFTGKTGAKVLNDNIGVKINTVEDFAQLWKSMGYSVYAKVKFNSAVVVAVKGGNDGNARLILEPDLEEYENR